METETQISHEAWLALIDDSPAPVKTPATVWQIPGMHKPEGLTARLEKYVANDLSDIGGKILKATAAVNATSAAMNNLRPEVQGSKLQPIAESFQLPQAIQQLQDATRATLKRLADGMTRFKDQLLAVAAEPTFKKGDHEDETAAQVAKLTHVILRESALTYLKELPQGERLLVITNAVNEGKFELLWAARSSWSPLVEPEELRRIQVQAGEKALPEIAVERAELSATEGHVVHLCAQARAVLNASALNTGVRAMIPPTETFLKGVRIA